MTPDKKRPLKRVTYIALSKKTIPMLLTLYSRFKLEQDIYSDGTLERVFAVRLALRGSIDYLTSFLGQAFSIPMKLKYDAPPPSKHGSDPPLWKTATTNFLEVVKQASAELERLGEGELIRPGARVHTNENHRVVIRQGRRHLATNLGLLQRRIAR